MYVIRPASQKHTRSKIKVGKYVSTVTCIAFDDDYVDNEAFRVEYTLMNQEGTTIAYSELFHFNDRNERTTQFFRYLEDNDITFRDDGLPNFEGVREQITLKKSANFSIPIIVERSIIVADQESCDG